MTNQHTTPSAASRLASKTRIDEHGCHVWLGALSSGGYGNLRVDGRVRRAHKVAWELTNGPVPDGLQLDHLCRNRACVNPAHLEPVTNRENTLRGRAGEVNGQRGRSQTHCKRGHELSGDNAREKTTPEGWRIRKCRACERFRHESKRARVLASQEVDCG